MTGNKKFLFSALAFVMAGCVSVPSVQAADDAILYKIHDVKPIKNDAGVLVGCDYNATFFNRTSSNLKSADINLVWFDDTVNNIAQQDQKKNEQASANRNTRNRKTTNQKLSETSSVASVSSSIQLANLAPSQQKTVHAKISSDRCFLLIGEASLAATNCDVASADNTSATSFKGNQGCNGLFKFVPASDPQYYSEFKQVSPEEEKAQQENTRIEQRNKINQAYGETLAQFKKVTEALNGIKGDVNPDDVEAAPAASIQAAPVAQSQPEEVSAANAVTSASETETAPVVSAPAQMNEAQLQDKLDQLFPETASEGQPESLVPQSEK